MQRKSINIGLSPNLTKKDTANSLKILFQPGLWKKGNNISNVEKWFKRKFAVTYAVGFNAGRSALLAILESCGFNKADEILIQAYSCVAVPNSVIWAGAKPVYVDIDNSLNIDIVDAEKKITAKSRALIIQHTFGVSANIEKIISFCRKHNLVLIEDCAHALGATHQNQAVGTFGQAAFFSFGRDKIISSVFGGLAITNDKALGEKILKYQNQLAYPANLWIFQQLLHPFITFVSLKLYNYFSIGKAILFFSQKFRLISFPVYEQEKIGDKPKYFPKKYPNALAFLLLHQLKLLEEFNRRRQKNADYFFKNLTNNRYILPKKDNGAVYLRFNILSEQSKKIMAAAKAENIVLGNWYNSPIAPQETDLRKVGYKLGSCPNAEKAAKYSVNLPTYYKLTELDLDKIVQVVKQIFHD